MFICGFLPLDGIQLFRSENNVILSEGIGGVIHPRYFKKVINRTTGNVVKLLITYLKLEILASLTKIISALNVDLFFRQSDGC